MFAEDMDILDAQQQNIYRCGDRKLQDLKFDSGGAYARRIVERELEQRRALARRHIER